jgi:AAA domain
MSVATIPQNGERPHVPPGGHPIESKRYIIPTRQIDELCAQAVNLVNNRTPGGVFWARPRTGKSSGLCMLKLELETVFPGTATMLMSAWDYTIPKEAAFLVDLLKASGHLISKKGTPEEQRDRLVEFLSQRSGYDRRIVLIIDEAQQLHEKHYRWLMGIHNLLAMRGVNLITLLVGQHQLLHQRTAFLVAEKENIVGRFMVHAYQFRGICDFSDFEAALASYDANEFPDKSGWSFSRYFAPELYAAGWRLQKLSPRIWDAIGELRRLTPANRAPCEIQMQYFCRTVEHILMNIGTINANDDDAIAVLIKQAIGVSGYPDVLLL